MDQQFFFNDKPLFSGESGHDLLQQLHKAGTVHSVGDHGEHLSGSRLKFAMHPRFPPFAIIIRFKNGRVRTHFPFFNFIGLDRGEALSSTQITRVPGMGVWEAVIVLPFFSRIPDPPSLWRATSVLTSIT